MYRCPICKNKTEKIVINFLQDKKINTIIKFKLANDTKKYDILCKDYKIIIEIDGAQHFKDIKFFKSTAKENQENDKNKMLKAMKQGFSFIRIFQEDIWNDKIDWQNIILNNLKIRYKPNLLYFSSIETLYDNHLLKC
jgi:very-short-patch-repair endonuclease